MRFFVHRKKRTKNSSQLCANSALLIDKIRAIFNAKYIDQVAKKSGFVVRKSKVSANTFLEHLLLDHLSNDNVSLTQHCISMLNSKGIDVSKQALSNKFNCKSVAFVKDIVHDYLQDQLTTYKLNSQFTDFFKSIRIMDATQFKLPAIYKDKYKGYNGSGTEACCQIQYEYDILNQKIITLELDAARVSDLEYAYKSIKSITPNELILRDCAYGSIEALTEISEKGAFFISKIKDQISIFEKVNNEYRLLSYKEIIRRIKKSGTNQKEFMVYIGRNKFSPMRLIARALDNAEVQKRIRRKNRSRGKISKESEAKCELNLIVTNIPAEKVAFSDIYPIYKIRWQIEIVFKTWKSILKIHHCKKMKVERFECYLYSKLLWMLISRDMVGVLQQKILTKYSSMLSEYKCFSIIQSFTRTIQNYSLQKFNRIEEWIIKLQRYFEKYGVKEKRKNHSNSVELLKIKVL